MVQSLNTKVDLVVKGTSFQGLNSYGQIMIGDRAFEYYNERRVTDFIQIPWEEIDYVIASVLFKGSYIPRYAIRTKRNGTFTFASRKPKQVLRTINQYIPRERMVHSLSFFQVLKRAVLAHVQKK